MNSKVIFALLLVGILCTSTMVEGRSKFHKALKRVGHAIEKVGKKALEDGTVSKVLVATALGRKRRSVENVALDNTDHSAWNQDVPYPV